MSAAAELLAGCGAGEFSPLKSPENKAFTLLANDGSDACGAAAVDAADAGAGGASLPVNPATEEHAASVTASAATLVVPLPTLPRKPRRHARGEHSGCFCKASTSAMRRLRFWLLMVTIRIPSGILTPAEP
jgi:hypothetical protein